jgi:hypothetical protein
VRRTPSNRRGHREPRRIAREIAGPRDGSFFTPSHTNPVPTAGLAANLFLGSRDPRELRGYHGQRKRPENKPTRRTPSESGNGREQLRDRELAVSDYAFGSFGEKPNRSGETGPRSEMELLTPGAAFPGSDQALVAR